VVIPDAGLESALRVLDAVEGESVRKLIVKLRSLVPEKMLIGLISQLARQLPSHALCLAALIILEPHSERALQEAFGCFAELLSQVALDARAIDLVKEVSERLSSSQLNQINGALGARPSEGRDGLDGLRLKEAYALLREGEVEAAICLVNTLRITPHLEKEVLRFFDEAGLSSGKVPILELSLSAKLEEISRDSPSLAEALSILHQLHKEALRSHNPEAADQCLISLKAEILNETEAKLGQTSHVLIQDARIQRLEEQTKRKEADDKETLASLMAKVEALTEELVKAGVQISQFKRAQDAWIQRSEATEECLISLRAELRALHEQAAISEAEAKRVQSFIEKFKKTEVATQKVLSTLTGEIKLVRKNQEAQARLGDKLNKGEATTQYLNTLRGEFLTLRNQLRSQCKQVQLAQEAMIQRLEEQTQKTEANALKLNRADTSLQDTREALHLVTLPTFIYSYEFNSDQLHKTNLVTGEQSRHRVPSYRFKEGCCWSEVPGGSLLITGGGHSTAVREVVKIDVGIFEVSHQRDMHTPRSLHAAVYHTPHLYVLGGHNNGALSECERCVCEERYFYAEYRWQALPPLPRACWGSSGVVLECSLYVLGGLHEYSSFDLVQKLSLESLTWELMQLRLPFAGHAIPCFKLRNTEVYLVVNKTLCSFTGLKVRPLKTLTEDIRSWYGASYYRRGTLYYCSTYVGAVHRHEIGSLSN
jgi:hypothetical protein